jgi:CMP/dCMP kinase
MSNLKHNIITIDGLAASGKGTLSRKLANYIGYQHLDNGLVFRAVSLKLKQEKITINFNEYDKIISIIETLNISIDWHRNNCQIYLDNQDVTHQLSNLELGQIASTLSSVPCYFLTLVKLLHQIAENGNVIADGRSVGSFIFPQAQMKFYIHAEPEIRAKRRYQDLINQGFSVKYHQVLQDLLERDNRDQNRNFCPLVIPQNAIVIDTSHSSPEESLQQMIETYYQKKGEKNNG